MKLFVKLCLFYIFAFSLSGALGYGLKSYFTVIGPRTVQFGSDYAVQVTYRNFKKPGELKLTMDGSITRLATQDIKLKGDGSQLVSLNLKHIADLQNYKFGVYYNDAQTGNETEQYVDIHTISKTYSVFLQTGKAIYKPSDKIVFRALLLDFETRPYQLAKGKRFKIEISDAANNVVYKNENVKLHKGVFNDSIDLSDAPIYGEWNIRAFIDDKSKEVTTKHFTVREYVLPRFEVFIDTNEHVVLSDNNIQCTIYAKYTFGKFVQGKAVITAKVYDSKTPDKVKFEIEKTSAVLTKQRAAFDMRRDLKIYNSVRNMIVNIAVEFEEELTGKKQTNNVNVTVHRKYFHQIKIETLHKKFKPGFPYKLQTNVKTFDGQIESNKYESIKLQAVYFYHKLKCDSDENKLLQSSEINLVQKLKEGIAEYELYVPENTTFIQLTANFMDSKAFLTVHSTFTRTRVYLQASIVTKNPSVGEKVAVNVKSTDYNIKEVNCIVIGRTGVIFKGVFKVENNSCNVTFAATSWMVPVASVIVYYIHHTGEVIYDQFKLKFKQQLPNKIDITWPSAPTKPGEWCNISISTRAQSYVGLLAIDQRVLLLKSGNDIDEATVDEDLMAYNVFKHQPTLHIDKGPDKYLDFGDSNAFVITNAENGREECAIDDRIFDGDDEDFEDDPFIPTTPLDPPKDPDNDDEDDNIYLRKKFPETWIFESFDVDETGKHLLQKALPDTLSSWIISGFSVDPNVGLGLSTPRKLRVFQPFFIVPYLPFSLKNEEVLKIPISVFNYMDDKKSRLVDVTLFNENYDFEFVEIEQAENGVCKILSLTDESQTKSVNVDNENSGIVFFTIKPHATGSIKIKVVARTADAGDKVERILLVENEGFMQFRNHPLMIDLSKETKFENHFQIFVPKDAIHKSIKIDASIVGDLLGPLTNVDSYIMLPTGCAEQRLIRFVPNVFSLSYLKAVNELTPEIEEQLKHNLRTGYSQMLDKKNSDGSFSIWSTKSDSVWLTAYLANVLGKIQSFISIDDRHIYEALKFLQSKQDADGSFPEYGTVSYKDLQTESTRGIALTAFTVIAFLENKNHVAEFKTTIDRALMYIDHHVLQIHDLYGIAIGAYALQLGKNSLATKFMDYLNSKAINVDDLKYWKNSPKGDSTNERNSTQVEIAAYALLAFADAGKFEDATPVMKWLLTQRNSRGGFFSTQDTVMGLYALSKIIPRFHMPNVDMNVNLNVGNETINMKVNSSNALTKQHFDIDSNVRQMSVYANGTGLAMFEISHQYYTKLEEFTKSFDIDITPKTDATKKDILHLEICVNYNPNDDTTQSNMAVMEIALPSGYVYDPETADLLKSIDAIKKIETQHRKTCVILYFNQLNETKVCPQIKAIRMNKVANIKQSAVKIYDYYEIEKRATKFYLLPSATSCGLL